MVCSAATADRQSHAAVTAQADRCCTHDVGDPRLEADLVQPLLHVRRNRARALIKNRVPRLVVDQPRNGKPLLLRQRQFVLPDYILRQRAVSLQQVLQIDLAEDLPHPIFGQVAAAARRWVGHLIQQRADDLVRLCRSTFCVSGLATTRAKTRKRRSYSAGCRTCRRCS